MCLSVQCLFYSAQCTVWSAFVQCIVYTVQCTVYTLHCTLFSIIPERSGSLSPPNQTDPPLSGVTMSTVSRPSRDLAFSASLDTGYWILDTGYWILDTIYYMEKPVYSAMSILKMAGTFGPFGSS